LRFFTRKGFFARKKNFFPQDIVRDIVELSFLQRMIKCHIQRSPLLQNANVKVNFRAEFDRDCVDVRHGFTMTYILAVRALPPLALNVLLFHPEISRPENPDRWSFRMGGFSGLALNCSFPAGDHNS
jgi:hypothetical protein